MADPDGLRTFIFDEFKRELVSSFEHHVALAKTTAQVRPSSVMKVIEFPSV